MIEKGHNVHTGRVTAAAVGHEWHKSLDNISIISQNKIHRPTHHRLRLTCSHTLHGCRTNRRLPIRLSVCLRELKIKIKNHRFNRAFSWDNKSSTLRLKSAVGLSSAFVRETEAETLYLVKINKIRLIFVRKDFENKIFLFFSTQIKPIKTTTIIDFIAIVQMPNGSNQTKKICDW